MTALRQKMIEDMQLRGLSPRTQETYVAAVRKLAQHFHKSPDELSERELRSYFLYLILLDFGQSNAKINREQVD